MRIVPFSLDKTPELTPVLISCYQRVFAAPPWNEEWWTEELVMDVLHRYGGGNASIFLAISDTDQVLGFSWGAVWEVDELSEELQLSLPTHVTRKVAYLKDVGVVDVCRQRGIAKALLKSLIAELNGRVEADTYLLARTLAQPQPSVVFSWFPKIGFETIAQYPPEDGRVILARQIAGVDDSL